MLFKIQEDKIYYIKLKVRNHIRFTKIKKASLNTGKNVKVSLKISKISKVYEDKIY